MKAFRLLSHGINYLSCYAGASPLYKSQVSGESIGEGSTNVGSRSWKRSEDGNIYVRCVTAVYALARDQSPRVACLGRQVLRILGVEPAQIVVAAKAGANGTISHERSPSVPALPPTSFVPGVLQRSTSWVASTRGGYILNIVFSVSMISRILASYPHIHNIYRDVTSSESMHFAR